jgi:Na+/proline symporter
MHLIDWLVLASTLLFIVGYGSWKTRKSAGIKGYMMGDQDAKWHTVGISVMATQASAITFLSTPGQAFYDGMGFVQFYFGLPIAMIIIAIVFVPIYRQLKIVTAYEYLDKRFNTNTRVYTALLFLTQRGLAAGITIFAPSIILSAIMGWDLQWLNIGIGLLVTLYTLIGGTKAVSITQKQQMAVILIGMVIAFIYIFKFLPQEVTFDSALNLVSNLCDEFNIPKNVISHNTKINNFFDYRGVLYKSNLNKNYTDLNPSWDFDKFKQKLEQI